MGLEKLTDPLLPVRSSSATLPRLVTRCADCPLRRVVMTPGPLSRLTPRPPVFFGGGELTRSGGSILEARRCDFWGTGGTGDEYPFGSAGTGGA